MNAVMMTRTRFVLALIVAGLAAGCSTPQPIAPVSYVGPAGPTGPTGAQGAGGPGGAAGPWTSYRA